MQTKPKILLLIATLDAGGAEKQIIELARLIRDRFDVLLCCLTRGGPLEERTSFYKIPYVILGKKFKFDFSVIFKLIRLIRKENIDVLHTWMFTSNFFGRIAGIIARAPCILTSERACDIWKTSFHFLVDRLLLLETDRVVCVSEGVKKFCMEKYGLTEEKASVIYNGIEITPPSPAGDSLVSGLNIPEKAKLILTAGRLAPQKGIKYLIRAMPGVLEKFPGVFLLVAGSGEELSSLEREAHSLGIWGRIKFLGFRKDIRRFMRASEIFVLPSLFEGLPNVALEAMIEERPVIATDIPGTNEVVINGETGILVPPADSSALCSAVVQLLSDRKKSLEMGLAGRTRAEKYFDIKNTARSYEKVYEEMSCLLKRTSST